MLAREHVIVDPTEHFLHIGNAYRGAKDSVCSLLRHFEELYTDKEGITRVPKGVLAATAGACEAISDGLDRIEITPRVIRNTEHLTAVRRGCNQLQQNIAAGLPESLPHEMVTATVKNVQAFLDVVVKFTREAPGIPNVATNPRTSGAKRVVDVDSVEANRPWRQANRPLSAETRDGLRTRMRKSEFYDTPSPESATSQAAKPLAPKPAAAGDSEEGALDIDHWLEETIPLLNTSDSDTWITSIAVARLRKVKNSALREERSKKRAKFRHSQGTCGMSGKGHWWRKDQGTQKVWYYLPSLSDEFKHRDAQPAQLLRATQKKS